MDSAYSSTDTSLSFIPISDWLISCCGSLMLHQKMKWKDEIQIFWWRTRKQCQKSVGKRKSHSLLKTRPIDPSLLNCMPWVLKTCLRASIPCVLTCSRDLRAYVLACLRALRTYVLTCQRVFRAYMLTFQRALHAYVLTCQRVLGAYILTC